MSEPTTIIVIGAGVIGLSTAVRLVSTLDHSNYKVVIVSKEWPMSIPGVPVTHSVNYASMWAGAHVRPIPASTPQLVREAAWLKRTVQVFEQQVQQSPAIGVTKCKGIELLESPAQDYAAQSAGSFAAQTGLTGYRKYTGSEVPEAFELAYEYDTYCINAPVYCGNLLRSFILQGGKCVQCVLTSEREAYSLVSNVGVVVNASGMGFGDPKCIPVRGQTVLTNFSAATKTVTRQSKDGSWSFIIPRFFQGGTIVGGTKEPGDYTAEPVMAIRDSLLGAGQQIAQLAVNENGPTGDMNVLADVVGRRPVREGGMRIEIEQLSATGAKAAPIVHAYGAGGRGFEISWGVAEEVADLVRSVLPTERTVIRSNL
ncbi:FAD dependent oxidoreductase [Paraphoma chrysanthemicola]|uniref:FAD dependent oxidoreductase n=1 Tax=Paraphoma chrysanthemicola TaxID=798071 RepID=A0A8K0VRR8_9PLEO|nr:FAD dependent oxidoreductase [Paraphoma chrysanthemicola]